MSTKHVVRLPDSDSIEPNRCDSVNTVKDKQRLLFGPVNAEKVSQEQETGNALKDKINHHTDVSWVDPVNVVVYVQLSKAIH